MASRPGLVTGKVGCYYLGSWEGWGCLELANGGSYPLVWEAVRSRIDQ